jgi:hypothetical protein
MASFKQWVSAIREINRCDSLPPFTCWLSLISSFPSQCCPRLGKARGVAFTDEVRPPSPRSLSHLSLPLSSQGLHQSHPSCVCCQSVKTLACPSLSLSLDQKGSKPEIARHSLVWSGEEDWAAMEQIFIFNQEPGLGSVTNQLSLHREVALTRPILISSVRERGLPSLDQRPEPNESGCYISDLEGRRCSHCGGDCCGVVSKERVCLSWLYSVSSSLIFSSILCLSERRGLSPSSSSLLPSRDERESVGSWGGGGGG